MPTILIAIDETHVASRLAATFKDAGYAVAWANNGTEAYRIARTARPDLVVADYRLARLGGLELCAKLAGDRLTHHTPVVLLSARGFGSPAAPRPVNVARVLTKPISPHTMLNLARTLLSRRAVPALV